MEPHSDTSEIDCYRKLLIACEGNPREVRIHILGGQRYDTSIQNGLRQGRMFVVQSKRKVPCVRKRTQDYQLISRVNLKVSLEIFGVQIAVFSIAITALEIERIAGVVEIGEKVAGRKFVAGERSRKSRTINSIRDSRDETKYRKKQAHDGASFDTHQYVP